MFRALEKRRCIPLALSLFLVFFFCASYWLWSGADHVRLVPSFHDGVPDEGTKGDEEAAAPVPTGVGTGTGGSTESTTSTELRPDEIILAEYDETPIREMCANSSWADSRNVVVNCESRVGGVGMHSPHFPSTTSTSDPS